MRNAPSDRPPDPLLSDSPPSPAAIAADPHYQRRIREIVRRKGVLPQDEEDVHQNVLLALLRCLSSVDPVRSMDALIATISARQAADHLRERGRRPVMEYDDNTAEGPPSSQRPIPAPDKAYDLKKQRETLDALLEQMENERHDVFLLVELEETTLGRAAETLGIPEATAQARLRKARGRFGELIDGAPEPGRPRRGRAGGEG